MNVIFPNAPALAAILCGGALLATSSRLAAQDEPADAAEEGEIEVVVAGTRLVETSGSVHHITSKKLERFEHDDSHALLLSVPGVYIRQEDGMGLRPNIGLRGGNADRSKKVTLMEDGVLFGPAPYSAPAAYYFPLLTRMTGVRVLKGPSAMAYGPQTVGGAVDFSTRAVPYIPSGALDLGVGEYGYQKLHGHFGGSTEQLGFLVEGVRLHNTGFKQLPDGAETGSTRNEWMVKSSYLLDPSSENTNEFRLKLTYSDEVSNETYLGLSDADFRQDPDRRYPASALDQMNNHRTSVVLSHSLQVPARSMTLTTTAYRHNYARVWRKLNRFRGTAVQNVLSDPDDPLNSEYFAVLAGEADSTGGADALMVGPNDRTFVSQGVQGRFQQANNWGPLSQRFEAGVRLHHDSIRRIHSQQGYAMSDLRLIAEDTPVDVMVDNQASSVALATHVIDAISWKALTLTPGVRVELIHQRFADDLNDQTGENNVAALMPGAGAFYRLTNSLGVLAGVYRGFSPPPPDADGEAAPEYSINYEAGARWSRGPGRAEVIAFYNDYSNLTNICTVSGGCLSENLDRQFDAGEARLFGLEVYLEHSPHLGTFMFPMNAAYTFTQSEFERDFVSADPTFGAVEAGDELPYVPQHQLNAALGVEAAFGALNASFNYISKTREQAGRGSLDDVTATDEQVWFDLAARAQLTAWGTLYLNVRNVLDHRNLVSRRPYGARPNAPRWISAGVKLNW